MTSIRSDLLDLIVKNACQEGDFVLSSGQKSSYYINCKQVTLTAQGALAVGRLLLAILPQDTQAVAGLTLGADPIVTAVSVVSALENQPIPALIVRKQPKGHGTKLLGDAAAVSPDYRRIRDAHFGVMEDTCRQFGMSFLRHLTDHPRAAILAQAHNVISGQVA